jgi:hypothetical protein
LDMFVNPKNKRKASVLDDETEKTEEGSVWKRMFLKFFL